MIKIDKDIPIPQTERRGPAKYPFADMVEGDSFSVPGSHFSRLHSAAYGWSKRHGGKFCVKKEDNSIRVWRLK